jgi:hypothetical protein
MANDLPLPLRRATVWLTVAAALLVLINCVTIAWAAVSLPATLDENAVLDESVIPPFAQMFILDFEANVPTWFSSGLLLYAAVLLALLAADASCGARPFVNHWRFLAVLFVYLSIDEAVSIHELAGPPLRALGARGARYHAWIIPLAVGLAPWRTGASCSRSPRGCAAASSSRRSSTSAGPWGWRWSVGCGARRTGR